MRMATRRLTSYRLNKLAKSLLSYAKSIRSYDMKFGKWKQCYGFAGSRSANLRDEANRQRYPTFDKRRISRSEKQLTNTPDIPNAIIALLRQRHSASTREMAEASGLSRSTIINNLHKLIEDGIVEPTQPRRSPKQRYRLTR